MERAADLALVGRIVFGLRSSTRSPAKPASTALTCGGILTP